MARVGYHTVLLPGVVYWSAPAEAAAPQMDEVPRLVWRHTVVH